MFRLYDIMTLKHVARISLNNDKNTCDRESTRYQTVLRFQIRLKEMFSNTICLGLIENLDESGAVLI